MMKKLLFSLFIVFMAGCASTGHGLFSSFNGHYIKKDSRIFYHPKGPEFYDLKDKISKQEYRRLTSYLQDCYDKEDKSIVANKKKD